MADVPQSVIDEHRIRRATEPGYKKIDDGVRSSTSESVGPLVYQGHTIRDRGEMMSLTDMWKASGYLDDRQPARWRRFEGTERFVQSLIDKGIVLGKHNEIFQSVRGGKNPGTWAHWQVGLAYAQYLSPEFHIWCNTVVRERMEAMARSGERPVVDIDLDPLREAMGREGVMLSDEAIRIIGGVVKGIVHSAITTLVPLILKTEREAFLAEKVRALGNGGTKSIVTDGREWVSVRQILSDEGFPRGTRGQLGTHVGKMLRDEALLVPGSADRHAPSGHWLFERSFATKVIKGSAAPLIASHRAKLHQKQGVLDFSLADRRPRR